MLQDNKVASTTPRSHAVAQAPGPAAMAQPFVAPALQLKAGMERSDKEASAGKAFAPFQAKTSQQTGSRGAVAPFQLEKGNMSITTHSSDKAAWHTVQRQTTHSAIQQKKDKDTNDNSTTAAKDRPGGTIQKKSDNKGIIQRKVLIQGAPAVPLLRAMASGSFLNGCGISWSCAGPTAG